MGGKDSCGSALSCGLWARRISKEQRQSGLKDVTPKSEQALEVLAMRRCEATDMLISPTAPLYSGVTQQNIRYIPAMGTLFIRHLNVR